jgi:hypothetical protein
MVEILSVKMEMERGWFMPVNPTAKTVPTVPVFLGGYKRIGRSWFSVE